MKTEVRPSRYIQIIGAGSVGLSLARRLRERAFPVVILEKDPLACREAHDSGFKVLYGDGTDPDFLALTGIYSRDILILTATEDSVNLEIARLARNLFQVERIIARINDPGASRDYSAMDIRTVDFSRQGALAIENLILRPNLFDVLIQDAAASEIQEIVIHNDEISGKALSDIHLPGNSLILFVKRGGETIIPHGKTRLYLEDGITLCGDLDSVLQARQLFQQTGEGL
jgi:Trk K+ transport system NAD-binding subunit